MLISERRRRVLEHVRQHGSASISQLAEALGVSASTVRRDMGRLEDERLLRRTHGGAVVLGADFTARHGSDGLAATGGTPSDGSDAAKSRIGVHAAGQVEDGSSIMILAGSTTAAMIPALYDRRLTVVTNGLEIAHALRHAPEVSLVLLGGYLHREQMTLLGPMAVAAIAALHVDVMFAGAWGMDAETGITGSKIIQAGNHDAMLRHADRLVVLADSTKLGRRGPTRLVEIEQVHTIVTDRDAAKADVERLRSRGVIVETV